MNRRVTGTVFAVGIIGGAALFWLGRGDADERKKAEPAPALTEREVPDQRRLATSSALPQPVFHQVSMDDDPIGPLRLEGIVLGQDDHPVGDATVFLDSNPPRTTTSNRDGSFYFDELVGRMYTLSARADGAAGGPVILRLSDHSDPVAIRVHEGARIEVAVIAKADGKPIEGATVGFGGSSGSSAITNAKGTTELRGVLAGGKILYATAPGYARHKRIITVPDSPGIALQQRIELTRGVEISGRVLDPNGKPVANAEVVARDTSATFMPANRKTDGVRTDKDGRFSIPALAGGAYRFVAHHAEHPPASTEPIELDGQSGRSDIVIVMEMGGLLAGTAVTPRGDPVAWANIHVGPDQQEGGLRGSSARARTAYADEDGRFRIKGVSRTQLVAMASSEAAASELVAVDLRENPERTDVVLTLSVDGVIAGAVVDDAGEPVAEAQVVATPDFWAGESLDRMQLRGPAFHTTDGGGAFRITGLPNGKYRLRAARAAVGQNAFLEKGVAATVGDIDVRLVLPAEGGIEGELALTNGKRPELASVSVGAKTGVPVSDGEFRIEGLPPGTYDVTVRGSQFSDHLEKDVEIGPGKVTDLGTLHLQSGRAVYGRVVDQNGAPVDGAQVVAARQLVSDGSSLTPALGGLFEERLGLRRGTSESDGGYRIGGIGEDELVIAAEHPERGRSHGAAIPPGSEDARIELRLAPFGSLEGVVTQNGKPASGAGLYIASAASEKQSISANTGLDGAFAIKRLPAATYKVTAVVGAAGSATMASRHVEVEGGKTTAVELDIVTGAVTLLVEVKGEKDAPIDAAQVFLFEGEVRASNAKELLQIFSRAATAGAKMGFVFPPKTAEFAKMTAGSYSACVIPINGDMSDPQFAQRLQRNTNTLAVHCKGLVVRGSPKQQRYVAVTPPMNPLPE
jgi:uncharacterized GH25 family protein